MQRVSSSFRDPDAFIYSKNGQIFRQINKSYKNHYSQLMNSGLYDSLSQKEWLIPHDEIDESDNSNNENSNLDHKNSWKIIKPEKLNFISYPYEWSFSQLKEAALLTLKIHRQALEYGMSLKDATNFNVQIHNGKMVFIDTCSLEIYEENKPWIAYKQFCEHFLSPLALMQYVNINLNDMLKLYINGIPLPLTAKLLPFKARMNFSIYMHIFLHGSNIAKHQHEHENKKSGNLSLNAHKKLIDNLYSLVKNLKPHGGYTQWQDYNKLTSYEEDSADSKKEIIKNWFNDIKPVSLVDLGCNDGHYSKLGLEHCKTIIASDMDRNAIDRMWQANISDNINNIYPTVLNISNPTPGIGWNNNERNSYYERIREYKPDCVMALALIHHLSITEQIPLDMLADFFSQTNSKYVLIEWVPADDHQSIKLIKSRNDQFSEYNEDNFIEQMKKYFSIVESKEVPNTKRTLFLFSKK